jgi:imidazolonepropionase-like amidohydrolase
LLTALRFQAATAHSFHLPEELALQSITSVPAKSLELSHRIGYVRPGYDADIVVFDSHPLSIGATPLQVYIDGRATLDHAKVMQSSSKVLPGRYRSQQNRMRTIPEANVKDETCRQVKQGKTVITGISTSHLRTDGKISISGNLTLVLENGRLVCFDSSEGCISHRSDSQVIRLKNGHVLPGLTAAFTSLGLSEIASERSTGDGASIGTPNPLDFAKYGVHLEGKAFERARIGGVTRSITAPLTRGFVNGVSTGIKTSGKKTILNGGIFLDDVALHFSVGQTSKGKGISQVQVLRN